LPSQSRHNTLSHSPTIDFTRIESDNCQVDSPYKSSMMHKVLSQPLESNIDVGNEELGVCKFWQSFNQASKIPSNEANGFEKLSCKNIKSSSLGNSNNP